MQNAQITLLKILLKLCLAKIAVLVLKKYRIQNCHMRFLQDEVATATKNAFQTRNAFCIIALVEDFSFPSV